MSKQLAKEKAVEKPDSHALSVRDRSDVFSADKQNGPNSTQDGSYFSSLINKCPNPPQNYP